MTDLVREMDELAHRAEATTAKLRAILNDAQEMVDEIGTPLCSNAERPFEPRRQSTVALRRYTNKERLFAHFLAALVFLAGAYLAGTSGFSLATQRSVEVYESVVHGTRVPSSGELVRTCLAGIAFLACGAALHFKLLREGDVEEAEPQA